ncbi:MAG TPA: PH domain-containing protein [Rubrobacteraceae bacterium]|nr:PH domain-containing protein [Rubrobacteraceae bacterium]
MSSEPCHLHPAAMLIDAIKTVRRSLSAFVIPGIAFLMSRGFDAQTIVLVLFGALVVTALAAFWGFLSWRATTYEVAGGVFRLRWGVVQKNERAVPLDHIQSVDTVQGIIQRLFNVVEVRIETAGGGASEPDASLAALDRADAEALRREIAGSRREPVETETAGPTVVRKLGTRDLLLAGATSGQIGVALSLIAVASQLFNDFLSQNLAQRLIETFAPRSVTTALLYVFILGLAAWLLAIGGTVLAHTGFTLSRDGDFLYIRRGLLERREATIPLARIQAVRIVEGLLRQPFGLASLRVESAGYGQDAGVSTTLFPLLPRKEVHGLLLEVAPEFAVAPPLNALPKRALRRYVFRSTLPFLVLISAAALLSSLVFDLAAWVFAALLLLLPAALFGWLRYRDAGWTLEEDRLVVRSRLLGRTTAIAPRRRLQSRTTLRSPFQRRVSLATFEAQVASGGGGAELRVTDLGADAADALIENLGPGA